MSSEDQGDNLDQTRSMSDSGDATGSEIGPYKLLRVIGEGGMGTVYLAQQHQPVKRRVALKIIKPGMDTKQVVARFDAERQALSMMDHPNIANVLDVGATEQGRPYFVMEHIKGMPITKYCDEKRLPIDARLHLFVAVCNAVQHAHQKGIIHRDLKPSNILVAETDDQPVPKIIDFGLAKALHQPLTDNTLHTQLGQVIGTLEYMSPEQSKLDELDVDTRTDIYSLGVLLYELLIGVTPFEKGSLRQKPLDQVLRIIREEDPAKPSSRISKLESKSGIAIRRATEATKLDRLLRRELDWIALKSLEKERGRRYQTANSFAQDVQRYLDDEPVEARPHSKVYLLQKFVRRNKTAVLVASLLGLAAIATALILNNYRQIAVDSNNELENSNQELNRQLYKRSMASVSEGWSLGDLERMKNELKDAKFYNPDVGLEWDFMNSRYRDHFPDVVIPFDDHVTGIALNATSEKMAVSLSDGSVSFFESLNGGWNSVPSIALNAGKNPQVWENANSRVVSSPDGSLLGIGGNSSLPHQILTGSARIEVFDFASGQKRPPIEASGDTFGFAFSPDNKLIAKANRSGAIELYELDNPMSPLWPPKPDRKPLSDPQICFSPDSRWLLVSGRDRKLYVYEANSGKLTDSRQLDERCRSLAISHNDQSVVIGGTSTIHFWSLSADGLLTNHKLMHTPGFVHSLAFSPDDSLLAAVDRQAIRIWQQIDGEWRYLTTFLHRRLVNSIAFDGNDRLISGGEDNVIKVWDIPKLPRSFFVGNRHWFSALAVAQDGVLAFSDGRGNIEVWDPERSKNRPLKRHTDDVLTLSFSPDGSQLISGGADGKLLLWDLVPNNPSFVDLSIAPPARVRAVDFSVDGKLVAGDSAGRLWLWNSPASQPKPEKILGSGQRSVFRARFSMSGKFLAVGGIGNNGTRGKGRTEIWQIPPDGSSAEPTKLSSFTHSDAVYALEFSKDEKTLFVATRSGELEAFDFRQTGRIQPLFATATPPFFVHSMTVSPDGDRLLTASPNGQIRFWDVSSGKFEAVGKFTLPERVREIAFSGNNKLVTASEEGWIRVWPFKVGSSLD